MESAEIDSNNRGALFWLADHVGQTVTASLRVSGLILSQTRGELLTLHQAVAERLEAAKPGRAPSEYEIAADGRLSERAFGCYMIGDLQFEFQNLLDAFEPVVCPDCGLWFEIGDEVVLTLSASDRPAKLENDEN